MTQYPDHLAIARQLLEQQGEINTLKERAEAAEAAIARVRQVHHYVLDLDGKQMCAAECEVPPCPTIQALDVAISAPEFPLPIRADGTHHYVSTYCVHGQHDACRRVCKGCPSACECPCGHPAPEPGCPYDYHDMPDEVCVCQPHYCGQAHGCPEGCPTHNHGAEDVPEGAIGGRATDEEFGDGDRCPTCGCVVGPDCEACERDCGEPCSGDEGFCNVHGFHRHAADAASEGPELTREELQALVDDQGQDLYRAEDLIAFVREMCDSADADGSPVTTERVRGWLGYTGCGGVLVLPEGGSGCGFPPVPPRKASPAVQRQAAERFGFPLRTPATQASAVAGPATPPWARCPASISGDCLNLVQGFEHCDDECESLRTAGPATGSEEQR